MSETRPPAGGPAGAGDAAGPDAPTWVSRATSPSRHGAIARRLFTSSNYKNWADKVRCTWDEPAGATPREPRR